MLISVRRPQRGPENLDKFPKTKENRRRDGNCEDQGTVPAHSYLKALRLPYVARAAVWVPRTEYKTPRAERSAFIPSVVRQRDRRPGNLVDQRG